MKLNANIKTSFDGSFYIRTKLKKHESTLRDITHSNCSSDDSYRIFH